MSKVIDRLQKLINHERSARTMGSVAEAEAFAAKIQALLTENKLSMSEVEFATRENEEPIDWEAVDPSEVGFHGKRQRVGWQILMANGIASVNTCETVLGRGNKLFFVGRTSDRDVCKVLFLYLLETAKKLAEKDALANMNEQRDAFIEEKGYYDARCFLAWMQDYRKAWYQGFTHTIVQRLETENERVTKEVNNEMAMIHLAKDRELIKKEVAENTTPGKFNSKVAGNQSGFMDGIVAGMQVDLVVGKNRTPQTSNLLGA
jgi:hypothetical protein